MIILLMLINGGTKTVGLFGKPVEHTLSPAMHNAAFDSLELNCRYLPFSVDQQEVGNAVAAIRALNLAGVNVTVPHKEAVIPFLDEVDEEARFIGAVNTITNTAGKLKGWNTDGRGFMSSLSENGINPGGAKVLIIGAGGASRAISYYLAKEASALSIFDIDAPKLEKLVSDLMKVGPMVSAAADRSIKGFDIIINATPLGLKKGDPLPFDASELEPRQTVCDLIYKKTPLLEHAEKAGCRTMNGLGMLLYQGVLAFELWMNTPAPVDVMKKALTDAISD